MVMLATALLGSTANAQGPAAPSAVPPLQATSWGSVGNWWIAYDSSIKGCFMQIGYTDQTGVRIGLNSVANAAYIQLANPAWTSFQPGNQYTVQVTLDQGATQNWTGAVATLTTGVKTLLLQSSDLTWMNAIARASVLDIRYNGAQVLRGNLVDSAKAAATAIACQLAYTPVPTDPFKASAPVAPPSAPATDPFKV
jgi:hypothetical protein